MLLQRFLILLFIITIGVSCSVRVYRPLDKFEVDPYTRNVGSSFALGDKISVVINPIIQKLQLTQRTDGSFSNRFKYEDYRNSIEASIQNMLDGSFNEIIFLKEAPENGLTLTVHRIKPKVRRGEFIDEHSQALEHLFDYDMSLSLDGKTISNASGINAHPVSTNAYQGNSWPELPQLSLKLVLEECFNKLFVEGLEER